jgi:hypothetical protein
LKDVKKLEQFIESPGDLKFDLDTAILMCRQGGYFDQAVSLAKIHGEANLVIDILIEDSKKYDEALDFICQQDAGTVRACAVFPFRQCANNFVSGLCLPLEACQGSHCQMSSCYNQTLCGLLYRQIRTPRAFFPSG